VKHGILGVFPTLLQKAALGVPGILDESVAIDVAEAVDPFKSSFNVLGFASFILFL
jgi:hypothetical protein